ncbi:hypothetical protein FRX31_009418, partial [Thalictrum thalictroides]
MEKIGVSPSATIKPETKGRLTAIDRLWRRGEDDYIAKLSADLTGKGLFEAGQETSRVSLWIVLP